MFSGFTRQLLFLLVALFLLLRGIFASSGATLALDTPSEDEEPVVVFEEDLDENFRNAETFIGAPEDNHEENLFSVEKTAHANETAKLLLPVVAIETTTGVISFNESSVPESASEKPEKEHVEFVDDIKSKLLETKSRSESGKTAPSCYSKVDLIFLLDTSGSIEQIYHEHVRWAVALVDGLPIEEDTVRVAAVQYAGR